MNTFKDYKYKNKKSFSHYEKLIIYVKTNKAIPTCSANMALYKRWITLLKKYLNTKSVNYILWFHEYIQWILNDTTFNSLFDLYNNLDKRSINLYLTTTGWEWGIVRSKRKPTR